MTKPPNRTYMYMCHKAFPQYVLIHYIIYPWTYLMGHYGMNAEVTAVSDKL